MSVPLILLSLAALVIKPFSGSSQSNIKELEKSLAAAIKQKDDKSASSYSYQLARLHIDEKNYNKAFDYLVKDLGYCKKTGDNLAFYKAYEGLGEVYTEHKKHTDAALSYEKAAKSAELLKNNKMAMDAFLKAGGSNAKAGQYKKAIPPVEKALAIALAADDESTELKAYSLLADYYGKLNNTAKAKEYTKQYNQILQTKAATTKIKELNKTVKKVVSEKEMTETRLQDKTRELGIIADSLRREEVILKESQLKEKESQLRLKENQLQIDLLSKDKELANIKALEKDAQLKNEQLWRYSILLFFVLSGALVSVVIIDYRKKIETNKKIEKQNENIKSSINYAKRIQEAMLPKKDDSISLLSNTFILFKPRDVVSGDFYWFAPINNGSENEEEHDIAFAAVDCTGHGVPGAFMSMIGMNCLNSIVGRGIVEPHLILKALHTEIRTALKQPETGNNDGMDIAVCVYKKRQNLIEYAGAKHALIYIQNNELKQVKGDVSPMGGSKSKEVIEFTKHEIVIDQPTMIYLFSDGYRDQFGGKDNTKFMASKFQKLLLEIHALPFDQQKAILDKTIEDWKNGTHQTDDILVMGVKIDPQV